MTALSSAQASLRLRRLGQEGEMKERAYYFSGVPSENIVQTT